MVRKEVSSLEGEKKPSSGDVILMAGRSVDNLACSTRISIDNMFNFFEIYFSLSLGYFDAYFEYDKSTFS